MSNETKIMPTLGRIVLYKLNETDVLSINRRREDALNNAGKMQSEKSGYQAHFGNKVEVGQVVSGTIVAVWTDSGVDLPVGCINIKLDLDGTDTLWVTRVENGEENGQWDWMPYQKGQAKKTEEAEAKLKE